MRCTLIQCQHDRLKLGVIEKNYKACKEQLTLRNKRIQELEKTVDLLPGLIDELKEVDCFRLVYTDEIVKSLEVKE